MRRSTSDLQSAFNLARGQFISTVPRGPLTTPDAMQHWLTGQETGLAQWLFRDDELRQHFTWRVPPALGTFRTCDRGNVLLTFALASLRVIGSAGAASRFSRAGLARWAFIAPPPGRVCHPGGCRAALALPVAGMPRPSDRVSSGASVWRQRGARPLNGRLSSRTAARRANRAVWGMGDSCRQDRSRDPRRVSGGNYRTSTEKPRKMRAFSPIFATSRLARLDGGARSRARTGLHSNFPAKQEFSGIFRSFSPDRRVLNANRDDASGR